MAGFLNRLGDELKKPGGAFRLPGFLGAEAGSMIGNKIMGNNQTSTPTTSTIQTTQRKQVQTYNPRYPGFDEEDYLRLEQLVDQQGVTGSKKAQLMDEAYQYYYPQVLNKHKLDERQEMINQWTYDNGEKLANGDKVTNAKYRLLSLTQMAKEKFDIAYNVEDAQIIDSIKEKVPNGEKLLTDFLNTGNPEILYASGIYDKGQQAQDFRSQKDIANSVLGGSFWKNVWNNMYANSFAPLDSAEKFIYRGIKNAQMLGTKIDDYFADKNLPEGLRKDAFGDKTAEQIRAENQQFRDTARREIDDYIGLVNDANQRNRTSTVNPIVDNYYQRRNFTDLLAEGDIDGFFYKGLGDAASNRDMPVIIGASIVNPAMGTALMGTNSYVRESEEAYETMRRAGATHEQAEVGAGVVGLVNSAIEVYLDKMLGGTETTASTGIRDAIKKNVMKEVTNKPFEEIVSSATKTYVGSSLEEGLEEWLQNIVTNAAEMTVKENPEWKDLFEGGRAAAEGGIFNPFNILAPGGDIARNTDINTMQQSMIDGTYNLGVDARNVTDSLNNGAYNLGETTRTITDKVGITNDGTTSSQGNVNTQGNVAVEGSEMVTPQGTETTVDETVTETNNGDKATLKEELYSIDPTLKKNLQNNPYTAEVWQRTKDYIDKNGRPERSNDVAKALIVDVADKVQEKLVEKMEEGGKNGKLYQTIDNAGFTVDLTELKDGLDEMLEGYGIEIEDGKLNFDKTAIDGSEASNIRKIYNWLQDTNAPMSEKEFRTRFKQAMKDMVDFNPNNKDQAGRRRADTPGDKVIKGIMKKANDLAHAQIPELAELDKIYSEWTDIMDEVSDGLVYKDAAKRGVIKDNVYQIIKNLDEPSRRQMVNRLEKLIPGIKDEVNAINQMPKVIDHIYNPSKLQQGLTSEGVKTVGAIGGLPGYLLAKWGGEGIAKLIDSQKSKAWNEVLQETSEEGKAKMAEIQAKIEENKRLTKEQEARLQGLKDRLLEKMATVEKTDAEQSAWESYLADLEQDEVIDMPEEVYDQWEEVTTTPKKKTSKKGLDKNQASSKTATDTEYVNETPQDIDYEELAELENETPQRDVRFEEDIEEENLKELEENENETPSGWLEEFETKSEIETLPADVSIEKEAKETGPKRIAPDRVPRQQLTFDEGVNKINNNLKTVAEYMKLRSEFYTAGNYNDSEMKHRLNTLEKEVQQILYGKNGFNFQSTRSKEFNELWKNITDNKNNPAALREVAKTFYISKVKKDISKGYQFPIEVLEKIPGAKKALDARERYQKGLDTSFSAKDARIDYSEKDKIGGGIKSQDGKQVTKEQKDNIVKGILDFQDVFGIDVKKIAEDKGIVFVDLHGGNAFLSQAAGLYREATKQEGGDKNVSVSVGGSETIRWKDNQTKEWKTEKVNTTMSHELGHAMDYLVDKKLLDRSDYLDLYQKYKKPQNRRSGFAKYLERPTEVTARAFEEYMDVAKGGDTYYDRLGYWNKEDFEYIVKPILEEAIEKKLSEWRLKKS